MTQPNDSIETKLFFGFNNAEGTRRAVSDEAWTKFLVDWVTPLFPGFTVFNTLGFWQGKPEESRVVLFLRESSEQSDLDIEIIRQAYCKTFRQTCVARVDAPVKTWF